MTFSRDSHENPKVLARERFQAEAVGGIEVSLAGHANPTFANRYLNFWIQLHPIAGNDDDFFSPPYGVLPKVR